jgi:transposase
MTWDDAACAAMRALGMDPAAIVPGGPPAEDGAADAGAGPAALSDSEWRLIQPHLPAEAPQLNTMLNRTFIDAVLDVMRGSRRWTDLEASEPVRRRFARWAHAGIWQELAAALALSSVSETRKSDFLRLAQKAEQLRQREAANARRPRASVRL